MAVYNQISSKQIIGKLYRDLFLEDSNYDQDFLEWIGEALSFIGAGLQFEAKQLLLDVENFKVQLPIDLIVFKQLQYNDNGNYKLISYNPKSFKPFEDEIPNKNVSTQESFTLVPGYIHTTFEEGEVLLAYKAASVDEQGYPMVPDNQYYKDALFWYCYRQMLLRGYISRVEEINYFFADEKWKFYCTAARNQANYPDLNMYERFRELWSGMISNRALFENGFDTTKSSGIDVELVDQKGIITTPDKFNNINLDGGSA